MMIPAACCLLLLTLVFGALVQSIEVDWENDDSVKAAAKIIIENALLSYKGYLPGQAAGVILRGDSLADNWWWSGSVLFGCFMEYASITGDTTYNEMTRTAIAHQAGPKEDFLTANWTAWMGNDDQGFWGMTAMEAAELAFENPKPNDPQWLASAQGVFNTMAANDRHDGECGVGLRWQIHIYAAGYDYKNSISNGCFFNIGARLARYTGNKTYEDWADKIWDWEVEYKLITKDYAVLDGTSTTTQCQTTNNNEYSYNTAVFIQGAAFLYNHTNSDKWRQRVEGLLDNMLLKFFSNNIAMETICQDEKENLCGGNEMLFKGISLRSLVTVAQLAPFTQEKIYPVLRVSAEAALRTCTGGENGKRCGYSWFQGTFDREPNIALEMSALGAVLAYLQSKMKTPVAPVTESTGGTSKGNPEAGGNIADVQKMSTITTASKVAASILTLFVLTCFISVLVWMHLD